MHRKRIIAVLLLIIATIITIATAFKTGINPPAVNVAGSFGAILFLLATAKILDVKDDLFYCGVIFVYLASPIGSVLDLYRRFGPYDKIIHFISGILLASLGMLVISKLLKRAEMFFENKRAYLFSQVVFAFFFSSACAGIWEMFEFTADKLAGGGMQRGMLDTLTDMIAGNSGALLYCFIFVIMIYAGRLDKK